MAKEKAKAKFQLRYSEKETAVLNVRLGKGSKARKLSTQPGDVIIKKKRVTPEDCGGDNECAKNINKYFDRLVNEGRARFERVMDDSDDELELMNAGVGVTGGDDGGSTDAGPNST